MTWAHSANMPEFPWAQAIKGTEPLSNEKERGAYGHSINAEDGVGVLFRFADWNTKRERASAGAIVYEVVLTKTSSLRRDPGVALKALEGRDE